MTRIKQVGWTKKVRLEEGKDEERERLEGEERR